MKRLPYWWPYPWWRHQVETFSALLALCAGNSLVTGEFPSQRPVTWSFDVSFDLHLNKQLRKQSWRWWLETPSHPLWHHYNDLWKQWRLDFACWSSPKYHDKINEPMTNDSSSIDRFLWTFEQCCCQITIQDLESYLRTDLLTKLRAQ